MNVQRYVASRLTHQSATAAHTYAWQAPIRAAANDMRSVPPSFFAIARFADVSYRGRLVPRLYKIWGVPVQRCGGPALPFASCNGELQARCVPEVRRDDWLVWLSGWF